MSARKTILRGKHPRRRAALFGTALAGLLLAFPSGARAREDLNAAEVFKRAAPLVVVVRGPSQVGAGIVVDGKRALVLTCQHVIRAQPRVRVQFRKDYQAGAEKGKWYDVQVVREDLRADLALLAIADPPKNLGELRLDDSGKVAVAEPVYAMGHPLGRSFWSFRPTIVSSVNVDFPGAFEIATKLEQGFSGGPLLSARAEVLGVNSFVLAQNRGNSYVRRAGVAREFLGEYLAGLNDRLGAKPYRHPGGYEIRVPAGWSRGAVKKEETDVIVRAFDNTRKQRDAALSITIAGKGVSDPISDVAAAWQALVMGIRPGARVIEQRSLVIRRRPALALLGGFPPKGGGKPVRFLAVFIDTGDRAHVIAYTAPAAAFEKLLPVFQDSVLSYRWPASAEDSLNFATPRATVNSLMRFFVEGDRAAWITCWDLDAILRRVNGDAAGKWTPKERDKRKRAMVNLIYERYYESSVEHARQGDFRIGEIEPANPRDSAVAHVYLKESENEDAHLSMRLTRSGREWKIVGVEEMGNVPRHRATRDTPEHAFEAFARALAEKNTAAAVDCVNRKAWARRLLKERGLKPDKKTLPAEQAALDTRLRSDILPRVARLVAQRLSPLADTPRREKVREDFHVRYATHDLPDETALEIHFRQGKGGWEITDIVFPAGSR